MNQPWVYMCPPSWTPLPPPSPSHPSGLSQCTPHLLLKVFLPHLFLGIMNLSISINPEWGEKKLNHYRENNGCYDKLFCIHTPLPSTTFSSNLRALSLGSVSTMGPQPRHLLRGFSSGSSHLLPGSLNFLSGSSFSSPSVWAEHLVWPQAVACLSGKSLGNHIIWA